MSDVDGAAPAAAEPASAPAPVDPVVDTPNPISTEGEPAKPEPKAEPKKDEPVSTREALKRAAEKVEKDNTPDPKAKAAEPAKEPAKTEPERDETGKFVAKDAKPATDSQKPAEGTDVKPPVQTQAPQKSTYEAPKRFSEDAKKVWETAPDPVKAEVARMERELTQGLEKHRVGAEKYESVRQFDEMAAKSGTTLDQALHRYVGMENKLRADPIGGLNEICQKLGLSLRDVAAHVMGQTPEQTQSQADATIRELKNEIANLKEQVGGVTKTITHQREQSTLQEVNKFASEHPRFEELAEDIGFFMQSGRAKDLSEAYDLAERLNPAPVSASTVPPAASSAPEPIDIEKQILKGSKSPTGAPTPGSDPAAKQPSKTAREAVRKAFAQAM